MTPITTVPLPPPVNVGAAETLIKNDASKRFLESHATLINMTEANSLHQLTPKELLLQQELHDRQQQEKHAKQQEKQRQLQKQNSAKIPKEELPILQELYNFRHALQQLRKSTHGALTLSDVDAKATELASIMQKLREVRVNELECSRNRVDDVLDSIWMLLFYIWGKIAGIDEALYPRYVALVSLARQAEALRFSGAWTMSEVHPLNERARELEEEVAAHGGRFLDPNQSEEAQAGDRIPHGQAVLVSLMSRVHRSLNILNAENDCVVNHLKPTLHELNSILHELEALEQREFTEASLAPLADRLYAIEASRGPTGRFNAMPSQADPIGQATCAGILDKCFDKLISLQADLDPVVECSPLRPIYRSLIEIHSDLVSLVRNPTVRRDPQRLSELLEPIQHNLESIEKRRTHGTFVPHSDITLHEDPTEDHHATATSAAALPGQATLHKLLHACHQLVTKLVDPLCLPVGEGLVGTYEVLQQELKTLRRLRSKAATGRNLKQVQDQVEAAEAILESIESQKVKGLFMGAASAAAKHAAEEARAGSPTRRLSTASGSSGSEGGETAKIPGSVIPLSVLDEETMSWLHPQGLQQAIPDGQAVISALVDECDSLIWEVRCLLARQDLE
ncbi:hypothetical protein HDU76_002024 [Blyttiomyces sp. JEL0837]|nr:hypothetical protein HDU76_002024 [Blyttiomyces sp. JEL0837]